MKLTVKLWLLMLAATLPGRLLAQAAPVVVGFDHNAPPFMSAEKGRTVGIYPSLVAAVFKDAGVPFRAESAPFARVIFNVDRGLWGAGGILKTPARIGKYDFSDYLYLETLVVYYNSKSPIPYTKLSDLRSLRVGTLQGWSYGEAFDVAIHEFDILVKPLPSDEQNFRKLQLGRLDAVIVLEESGAALMATGQFSDLTKAPHVFRQNPSFIAFNKSARQGPLLAKLNKSLARLRKSGQLAGIARTVLVSEHQVRANLPRSP